MEDWEKMRKTEEKGMGSGLYFLTHYSNIPSFQCSSVLSFHHLGD
jgi:hypothetical protein